MNLYYCHKCDKPFLWDQLNPNEQEEYTDNHDFVCSGCINTEMGF